MSATAVTITLSPAVEALIKELVASGRYADADEVVREAVRLLVERDRMEWLRAEIDRGFEQLDRGEGLIYTPELMERLKREAAENARQGKPVKDAVRP
jgi:antitoxin ParD1/3/4